MTALDPVPRPAPQPAPLCPVAHGRPYDPLSPEAAIDPEPSVNGPRESISPRSMNAVYLALCGGKCSAAMDRSPLS